MSDIAHGSEPGSGFYRPGNAAPGSVGDIEGRKQAAYRCVIFKMRGARDGLKLLASEVLQKPVGAAIVCTDMFTRPDWHAAAMSPADIQKQVMQMHRVRLVRVRGGFRQYQGVEYSEGARSWAQTWFCAPNEAAGIAVLDKMVAGE